MTSQLEPSPILAEADVALRMLQLAELQAALEVLRIRCVLARNHKLVLRYSEGSTKPSGLTEPRLHILGLARAVHATADGTSYRLDSGAEFPVTDPAGAAAGIRRELTK